MTPYLRSTVSDDKVCHVCGGQKRGLANVVPPHSILPHIRFIPWRSTKSNVASRNARYPMIPFVMFSLRLTAVLLVAGCLGTEIVRVANALKSAPHPILELWNALVKIYGALVGGVILLVLAQVVALLADCEASSSRLAHAWKSRNPRTQ